MYKVAPNLFLNVMLLAIHILSFGLSLASQIHKKVVTQFKA